MLTLKHLDKVYDRTLLWIHMKNNKQLINRLDKIKKFYSKHRHIPSYSEMCSLFGFASKNAVTRLVDDFISLGYFTKIDKVISPAPLFFSLPHLGHIKAGHPAEVNADYYDETNTIYVGDDALVVSGSTYVLTVSGDSMTGAGIFPGDLAIIDKLRGPRTGDIIAACVDDEWTLKYYRKYGSRVFLEAANPKYEPIYPENNLTTGGVLVKLMRTYKT